MVGKLSTVLLAWAAFLTLEGMALAQERIRIAWAGASPANSAIWVIQEKKLLQKQGVEPGNHKYQRKPNRPSGSPRRRN